MDPAEDLDSTMQHLDHAQRSGTGWDCLSRKLEAFLQRRQRRDSLPSGYECEDLHVELLAQLAADLPRLTFPNSRAFWALVDKMREHAVVDAWRRRRALKRGGPEQPAGSSALGQLVDEQADPPSMAARIDEILTLERDCVGELAREPAREVYWLRRTEGLDYEAIAARMQRTAVSVKFLHLRARERVRDCLRRKLDVAAESVAGW